MLVIGISGKKFSGKSTVAYFIREYLINKKLNASIYRTSFAKTLKYIIGGIFNIDPVELNSQEFKASRIPGYIKILKNDKIVNIVKLNDSISATYPIIPATFRDALQFYGDFFKLNFGENFWCNMLKVTTNTDKLDVLIIDDIRFKNEIEFLQKTYPDFVLIRINRPDLEFKDNHSSEVDLDDYQFDNVIINHSDLNGLISEIRKVLDKTIILNGYKFTRR